MSWSFFPMFSPRSFAVWGLRLKSLIYFDLFSSVWCKIRVQFHSFTRVHSVFPTSFIEEIILSQLCILGTFLKDQLTIYVWVFSGPYSVPLVYISAFMPVPCFDYSSFCNIFWNQKAWCLQLYYPLSRFMWLFRIFCGSIEL